MAGDEVGLEGEGRHGEPLLQMVMRQGRRVGPAPAIAELRARAAEDLARLPEPLRQLQAAAYPVAVSPGLRSLADEVDRRLARQSAHR